MESISASIVVLSGAILLATGGLVGNRSGNEYLFFVGGIVGALGLYAWGRIIGLFPQPEFETRNPKIRLPGQAGPDNATGDGDQSEPRRPE